MPLFLSIRRLSPWPFDRPRLESEHVNKNTANLLFNVFDRARKPGFQFLSSAHPLKVYIHTEDSIMVFTG
jgi:hypothetical protein